MSKITLTCSGCSCFCDDIRIEAGSTLKLIENICARGAALFASSRDPARRGRTRVGERDVSLEEAVTEATHLLRYARNPLIYGLGSSTIEAQKTAIEIARRLGAVLDSSLSLGLGEILKSILEKNLPSCSLLDIKDSAGLLVYWGSNPAHTHPRHLSKFTYYCYSDYDPSGWQPKNVVLSSVDIRESEFTSLCRPKFKLKPGGDLAFLEAVLERGDDLPEARQFRELLMKAGFAVVFCGDGLGRSLGGDTNVFCEMVAKANSVEGAKVAVIPMLSEPNLMGLGRELFEETGSVGSVSFAGTVRHGPECSFTEQVKGAVPDVLLCVGSDPYAVFPQALMSRLSQADIICVDSFTTLTSERAAIRITTAVAGLESEGAVLRMDGEKADLTRFSAGPYPAETVVLQRLLEGLG